ncbi:hypothetical protein SALBM311S_11033 [Streptomyces alboniger]
MRGIARRTWAAGLAAVTLAGLAACTAGDDGGGKADKAVVRACADGAFTWSDVTRADRLTGVSEVQPLGDGGGKLTKLMQRVYTPRPSVEIAGPDVATAEVLYSLGREVGEIDSDAPTWRTTTAERRTSSPTRSPRPRPWTRGSPRWTAPGSS